MAHHYSFVRDPLIVSRLWIYQHFAPTALLVAGVLPLSPTGISGKYDAMEGQGLWWLVETMTMRVRLLTNE